MTMRWVRYDDEAEPLPEHLIAGTELLLGIRLPADFRECLRMNHGAQPETDEFEAGPLGDRWEGNVGQLLTLDPRQPSNLFSVLANLAVDSQLPDLVVPIAEDGGGNFLCLDYRSDTSRSTPSVAFWFHELPGEDGVVSIAPPWSTFLTMLREPGS